MYPTDEGPELRGTNIRIVTDLPTTLKLERRQLNQVAFQMRKPGKITRIRERGLQVHLEYKDNKIDPVWKRYEQTNLFTIQQNSYIQKEKAEYHKADEVKIAILASKSARETKKISQSLLKAIKTYLKQCDFTIDIIPFQNIEKPKVAFSLKEMLKDDKVLNC
ncbi:hypothetical protein KUTeg_018752 [Tegillarca granosa]|uniref:Uncharacterized protein n=1 Tax=Tegillarca granosa TaxID=220873 RepID=A0ABQ9EIK4_TEGGR|nr:hypothetical protein KUTeg_018752 [Tegillarca granosa]